MKAHVFWVQLGTHGHRVPEGAPWFECFATAKPLEITVEHDNIPEVLRKTFGHFSEEFKLNGIFHVFCYGYTAYAAKDVFIALKEQIKHDYQSD